MMPGIDKEAEVLLEKAAEDESVARLPGVPTALSDFMSSRQLKSC